MARKIALAGNPNCGKTTLFNALTGANQYVGNWPGVTVEKKEGKLKGHPDVTLQDLPGIYSLSPYTPEEVVARNYLVQEKPDAILNIVDGANLERNLYLTTQLLELGIPMVVAVNMMDLVRKKGDTIDLQKLGKALGCEVVEMSARRGEGSMEAAEAALAAHHRAAPAVFTGSVARAIAQIEERLEGKVDDRLLRWYAVKLFERDEKVLEELALSEDLKARIERHIADCEQELDDDAESILTNQRYAYIQAAVGKSVQKKAARHSLTASDKIDRVVTNRVLALPIFVCVMFLVYAIAMGPWPISVGARLTDWANDGLFGDGFFLSGGEGWEDATARQVEEPDPHDYGTWVPGIPVAVGNWLEEIGCADWLSGLVVDGIVGGVGAVLGFVPQLLVLFLLLSILEDVGYMARIAFIMDRIFRKFGLSGKSFIPMLISTGCGVPGVMASRTIENERDRRMTIMTTCFIPCGAKMPIVALFAGALFGGSVWVAVSAYFLGVAAVILSGIALKKCRAFAGDPAPFVMELPAYHVPAAGGVLRAAWERGWSFIRRAGTVILASTVLLWFLQAFGFEDGAFGLVEDNNASLLAAAGRVLAILFRPLGFGTWQTAVGTITGLIAKENVVSTLAVLYPGSLDAQVSLAFTPLAAYAFLAFNLLCAPCFAAMGAIRREMHSGRWTAFAIGYMCAFAYAAALVIYQLGGLMTGEVPFGAGSVAAILVLAGLICLLARRRGKKGCSGCPNCGICHPK